MIIFFRKIYWTLERESEKERKREKHFDTFFKKCYQFIIETENIIINIRKWNICKYVENQDN